MSRICFVWPTLFTHISGLKQWHQLQHNNLMIYKHWNTLWISFKYCSFSLLLSRQIYIYFFIWEEKLLSTWWPVWHHSTKKLPLLALFKYFKPTNNINVNYNKWSVELSCYQKVVGSIPANSPATCPWTADLIKSCPPICLLAYSSFWTL